VSRPKFNATPKRAKNAAVRRGTPDAYFELKDFEEQPNRNSIYIGGQKGGFKKENWK